MSLLDWCQRIEHTWVATAISESIWLFPVIEGSHVLALPLSVGMIVLMDLRLLGWGFRIGSGAKIMNTLLRWSKIGFMIMFLTGALLFITHAGKAYENVFFRTKLIFLLILGINAAVYQAVYSRKMAAWDLAGGPPLMARFCAGLSLILWIGVIVCGRNMAFQF